MNQEGVKVAALSLAAFGALKVASVGLKSTKALLKYFVIPRKNLAERYGKGSWAVITGASDGLGKQYALELASEGFNIVLMGRNEEKTEAAAKDVRDASGVQTKVLIFDFASLHAQESAQHL